VRQRVGSYSRFSFHRPGPIEQGLDADLLHCDL
jgi:hypothetical protein